jgi:hypothetical protein
MQRKVFLRPKYSFVSLFLLLLELFLYFPVYSQSADALLAEQSGETEDDKRNPVISGALASAETLFSNAVLLGLTGYVMQLSWARPTEESVKRNLSEGWIWEDTDGFKVNNFGHPYHGSTYFASGRSNGFNFYESIAFNILGSATWETFGERQRKSVNDLIAASASGASLGEMLHRLYISARYSNIPKPLAVFISPMDGLTGLITRRKPKEYSSKIYEMSFSAGGVFANIESVKLENNQELYSFSGAAASVALNVVYGNPFEQWSRIPYEHFELSGGLDVNIGNYMDVRFISDGYLASFSPVNTASDTLSTGLSLHYDFVSQGRFDMYDGDIDQYGNALDWTVKYRHLFGNGFVLQLKLHEGGTFFGVSEYFSLESATQSLKNYGGGINGKFHISVQKEKFGKLSLDMRHYFLWTYPGTVAFSRGGGGMAKWIFAELTYEHKVAKDISIGASIATAYERGDYEGIPSVEKKAITQRVFVSWGR